MEGFIGIRCAGVGLTVANVSSKIRQVNLTNGMVIELMSVMDNQLMKSLGEELDCNSVSLGSAMGRVKDKCVKLRKNTNAKKALDEFLDSEFILPQRRDTERKPKPNSQVHCEHCVHLVEGLEAVEKRKEERIRQLEQQLEDCDRKKKEERRKALKKLRGLYSIIGEVGKPKDVIQKMKRLQMSRSKWRSKFHILNSSYKNIRSLHRRAKFRCKMYKARLDRLKFKSRKPCKHPKQQTVPQVHVDYIDDLHRNVDDLQEQVENLTKPLQTKEGRGYSSSIRQVSYFLQVSV